MRLRIMRAILAAMLVLALVLGSSLVGLVLMPTPVRAATALTSVTGAVNWSSGAAWTGGTA